MILWHGAVWDVSECELSVVTMGLWPLPVTSLSPVSPGDPHWLTGPGNVMAMAAGQWPGPGTGPRPLDCHTIATASSSHDPRPPPRHPSSSSLQILFQCQTQSWIFLSHPPPTDICSLTISIQCFFYYMRFKFVNLIMVDRILPKGQIRLRMYRRTFNYRPPEINNVQG